MIYRIFLSLQELHFLSILLRLLLAMMIGGFLGYEREKKHRPAGFRTYMIVCLGSALAMMVGLHITDTTGTGDPGRIAAQVVSGIGFLGAGTILVTRQNQVRGLTTAAGLWAVACIGLALGAGFYSGALICFGAIWVSIRILRFVDRNLSSHSKSVTIYAEFTKISDLSAFMTFAAQQHCTISDLEISRQDSLDPDSAVSVTMTLHFPRVIAHAQIVETYASLDGITLIKAV